jgi:hypothetical protein
MRYSQHSVSMRTLGLAFAVALSPALMQMDEINCDGVGDTRLSSLEFEVYQVVLPEGSESATLRAESVDPDADVLYNLHDACPPPIEYGHLGYGTGGGEVILEDVPFGHSTLTVYVHAPEGAAEAFTIHIVQPMLCE